MWCRRQWYAALSSGRHGVGEGCTWNVPGCRAFGLVSPENQDHVHSRVQGGESGLRRRVVCGRPELLP